MEDFALLKISNRLTGVGLFLLNVIMFSIISATVIFMFGGLMNPFNLVLGVLLSIVFCFFYTKKSIKETVGISLVSIAILVLVILVCTKTYDWTVDGNVYRKSMIGLLNFGWNPIWETFYSAATKFEFLEFCKETWYDAYPKATEIFAACVYSVTGNIESGKCFTIISMLGAFMICASYLLETKKLKKWQSFLCAFLCVWNPVSLAQCFTFYNDAFLGIMILLCFAAMLNLTFFEHQKSFLRDYWIIFITINLGLNSKFSALIFFAILCMAFFIYWIVEKCRRAGFANSKKEIFERFYVFAASVLSGVLFVGSTSYVTNTIRYHNPVYTMIGEGSTEIITSMAPKAIQGLSHFHRFVVSLFSPTLNSMALETVEPKVPFDFTKDSMFDAGLVDLRLSGWGVFFSGIFLISLFVIVACLWKWKKQKHKALPLFAVMIAIFIVLPIVVPGLFWARYFTMLFWVPIVALVLLFIETNKGASKHFLTDALVILMLLNTIPNCTHISDRFEEMEYIDSSFDLLEMRSKSGKVSVGYREGYARYSGEFFNFIDKGIDFTYDRFEDGRAATPIYGVQYSIAYEQEPTSSLSEYFSSRNENWVIFIAAKDEASSAINDETVAVMKGLGLEFNLLNQYRHSYLAVIDGSRVVYEGVEPVAQDFKYRFDGEKATVLSAGYDAGNEASVEIGGTNYSYNMRGLNFVIYDKESDSVIDSFYVDTCANNLISR